MINKTSPISFNGLKIEGVVSSKNFKKLGEFATAEENMRFINDLEKTYNTDVVINSTLDKIGFSHSIYGNLNKFGCPQFELVNFYSKVTEAMNFIKMSIKKAEKDYTSKTKNYEKIRRGC